MATKHTLAAASFFGGVSLASASPLTLGAAYGYNVFTFSDFTE